MSADGDEKRKPLTKWAFRGACPSSFRWKLTECAQRVLQKNSADMDLKVKGLRIRARGGKIAKGKSITAVARGLAVLMVAMLKKPDVPYVPLSEDKAKELAQIRAAMAAA